MKLQFGLSFLLMGNIAFACIRLLSGFWEGFATGVTGASWAVAAVAIVMELRARRCAS